MRYAGAGNKMVSKHTVEEKASLFGMLDRIESKVNESYAREAMPKLVENIPAQLKAEPIRPHVVEPMVAERKVAVGSDLVSCSNVIDVSAMALARGESAGEKNILKMGENVILERKEAVAATPVQQLFPPEFYMYFDIVEETHGTGPQNPSRVA